MQGSRGTPIRATDDDEMKEIIFKHYERLLYVRQPSDPDLTDAVKDIAGYLGLSLLSRDADYSTLEKALLEVIESEERKK